MTFAHIVLLAVTLPAMSGTVIPEAEENVVFLMSPPPRFKKKPPPPPEREQLEAVDVPRPDETPHEEEPLVLDEPAPQPEPVHADLTELAIPDAPPPLAPQEPIVVGAGVERPQRIHFVDPVYPELARRVRADGVVILEAIIDKNGAVKDLKVLKSLPYRLTDAAVEAVEQWRYRPSTMNGKPVEVRVTVTVIFEIS